MVGVDSNKDAIVGQVRDDSSFTIFKTGRGLTSEENTSEREGQNVSRFNESGVEGNRWIEKSKHNNYYRKMLAQHKFCPKIDRPMCVAMEEKNNQLLSRNVGAT